MSGISSCGACKFLRRRCTSECIFAPYFCYEQASAHFSAIHKVFGASNVSKLLSRLPVHSRSDAAITISYEALARMQDPIYGCVTHIFALQQQVACLEDEIETIGNQMGKLGVDIIPHEMINPYFSAHSEISSNYLNQPCPLVPHSDCESVGRDWCNYMELQLLRKEDETSHEYFDSSIFERLLQELNQEYYLHEEVLSQDNYLPSPWKSMH